MSIETWENEFYPINAEHTNKEDAVSHSLQKWLGLLPENLAKHGVELVDGKVMDENADLLALTPDDYVEIDGSTCSLCHHYIDHDWDDDEVESACSECPLYIVRGGIQCDDKNAEEWTQDKHAPWQSFSHNDDPKPMIMWLTKTKEAQCQP